MLVFSRRTEFVKTHFQAVLVANTAFFQYKYIKSNLIYPTQLQQSHIPNHSINHMTPTTQQSHIPNHSINYVTPTTQQY
jgi:hypothetical protein